MTTHMSARERAQDARVRAMFPDEMPELIGSELLWTERTPNGTFNTTLTFAGPVPDVHTRHGGRRLPTPGPGDPVTADAVKLDPHYTVSSADAYITVLLVDGTNTQAGLPLRPGPDQQALTVFLNEYGQRLNGTGGPILGQPFALTLTRALDLKSTRQELRLIALSPGMGEPPVLRRQRLYFQDSHTWEDTHRCRVPQTLLPSLRESLQRAGRQVARPDQHVLHSDVHTLIRDLMLRERDQRQEDVKVTLLQEQGSALHLNGPTFEHRALTKWQQEQLGEYERWRHTPDAGSAPRPADLRNVHGHAVLTSGEVHVPIHQEALLLLERCLQAWQTGSRSVLVWKHSTDRHTLYFVPRDRDHVLVHQDAGPPWPGPDGLIFTQAQALPTIRALNRQYLQSTLAGRFSGENP